MKEIKRYEIVGYSFGGIDDSEMKEDPDGDYVKHTDHKAVVETLEQENTTLEEEARTYAEKVDDISNIYASACLELKNCIAIKNKLEKENKELKDQLFWIKK